jgi:glutathione synthase/RimK-type ligase-like ATP-grasp enzyme
MTEPKSLPETANFTLLPQKKTNIRNSINPRKANARPVSFCALPEDGEVVVRVEADGNPNAILPNRLAIPNSLRKDLLTSTDEIWYPKPQAMSDRDPAWIINNCADADEYKSALIWLDENWGEKAPIFNHPRAIAQTRRDHSSKALQGIEGLVTPRCARFVPTSIAAFEKCFAENGFQFPVLVRPSRGQSGKGLQRIESPKDWHLAANTKWFGQPHFMTEYFDFKTAEGIYLKARVLFVGDQFFIRHIKAGSAWKVHNESATSLSDFEDRELEVVKSLQSNTQFAALCAEIPSRTLLDFCGMDVGVDPDRNRFVMFECNPAMTVFVSGGRRLTAERRARHMLLEHPASSAFGQHLQNTEAWAYRGRSGAELPSCRTLLEG